MINYDPHRWLDHFFDYKGSLVREISGRVLLCTLWSAGVVYFNSSVMPIGMPSIIHTLVGLALGLLLVFRTNASYDRFWEGRKLWGGIVNETRNLTRSTEAFLIHVPEARKEISLWTIAFAYGTMNRLRDKVSFGAFEDELNSDEVKKAYDSGHPALYAAKKIGQILQETKMDGKISDYAQVTMDQNVQLLVDYLGGCERIHKTPLPFAYVVHLRRALIIYCFSLPFALVDMFDWKWAVIFDTLFLSYVFFGIEEIGVEIEDPFGEDENDLPLETICASIAKNTRAFST
jgi:ion channel-forming bestrophin family protein